MRGTDRDKGDEGHGDSGRCESYGGGALGEWSSVGVASGGGVTSGNGGRTYFLWWRHEEGEGH